MAALPVTRATATLWPERPFRMPPALGVTLRGALGASLFDVVCVRADRRCDGCDLRRDCLIPTWYDPGRVGGNPSRAFALRVLTEDPLTVRFTFFGVLPRPTAWIEALLRALSQGLGADRVPFRVDRLLVEGEGAPVVVIDGDRTTGVWPRPGSLGHLVRLPQGPFGGAILTFPGVVQVDDPRKADVLTPAPPQILRAALRRLHNVANHASVRVPRWPDLDGISGEWTSRAPWTGGRYSARQDQALDLSGVGGELVLGPEVAPVVDLLAAASVLQVGRHTTSGLGALDVHWLPEQGKESR